MQRFILTHIIPLSIAFVLAYFSLNIRVINNYLFKDKEKYSACKIPLMQSGLYSNYKFGIQTEIDLSFSLNSEHNIVIFGSSELQGNDKSKVKPFNFIPDHTNINVLAIGHAGNQSFSIFSQLTALNKYIKDSKIVLMISPGWFTGSYAYGTALESFLEFNNERFLSEIYSDEEIPEEFKNYVYKYVCDNYEDITAPSMPLKRMFYRYNSNKNFINKILFSHLEWVNLQFFQLKKTIQNHYVGSFDFIRPVVSEKNPDVVARESNYSNTTSINWDSLYLSAIEYQKSIATNNDWGIYNEYYDKYTKGKKGHPDIVQLDSNQEFEDLKMLLHLLKYYEADPLFIIQPLNPYAYDNLDELKQIMVKIEKEIEQYDYPVYNMFVSDTRNYQIGLLTDAMHLGNYGWYKINRFILKNYLHNEKKNNN